MPTKHDIDPVLIERFAHGNGTIFVGAGISLGADLPSWANLIEPLRKNLGNEVGAGASFLDIAELYETKHSRGVLVKYLKERLGDVKYQLTQTHELIVSLPVQRIYTTNFDNLLEQASRKKQINRNVIYNASHVGFSDTSTLSIVKLHGDLDDAESLVITARDYYSFFSRNPAVADLLKVELQTHTVLFLGYSFSDPDLGMLLGKAAAQSGAVRPLLYSLQLRPKALAVQALNQRGVKVIAIDEAPGTTEADEQVEEWLRCFRKALIRYDRRRSGNGQRIDEHSGRYAKPIVTHAIFRNATRMRIDAGLQSEFRVVVVKGEPGIGKTLLVASAVADCIQSDGAISISDTFERAIWVDCSSEGEEGNGMLEQILDTIATALDAFATLEVFSGAADTDKTRSERMRKKRIRVNRMLQEYKVIVVLEDLSGSANEVKDWLENAGPYAAPRSKIIVTSRNVVLTGYVVEVPRLSAEEAAEMIEMSASEVMLRREVHTGLTKACIASLAANTGGNPQAIRMAIGLIKGCRDLDAACPPDIINTQMKGSREISALFDAYIAKAWDCLDETAHKLITAMLCFPPSVPVPSRLLRKALDLNDQLFIDGQNAALRFCIIGRDVENDSLTMDRIPRACLEKLVDRNLVDLCSRRLSTHLIAFLSDSNVICRPEIADEYWNSLVRDEMSKVDPYWPIIRYVMRWAVKKRCVSDYVVLLTHYLDSRLLNAERLEFLRAALLEENEGNLVRRALLHIDALAWTYIEEGSYPSAYAEIERGLSLVNSNDFPELLALADAWTARMKANEKDYVEAAAKIESAILSAAKIEKKYWISMRVQMIAGDLQMMQNHPEKALAHYRVAEACAEQYGGESNGYQTSPRIGFALLELKEDKQAHILFRRLAYESKVASGRMYGEYGLSLISARSEATEEALRRLKKMYGEIARKGSRHVLAVMAHNLFQRISVGSFAVR